MTEYKWSIKKVMARTQENGHSNVVYQVTWERSASLDGHLVSVSGTQFIPFNNDSNFVPSNELTEQIVLDWVKQILGNQLIEAMNNQLDSLLNEKINPHEIEIQLP